MIKRGDVYYADLDPVIGSEQKGHRPIPKRKPWSNNQSYALCEREWISQKDWNHRMVWFCPTYHERYCTSACNKVSERRKWWKPLSAFVFLPLQRQLLFLLEPAKDRAKIACIDCSKERAVNTYRGSSNLTSSVLVKLWSKFSAKSEIVQNIEKMTVFKGFKP